MNPGVEGTDGSQHRLDRERTSDVGRLGDPSSSGDGEAPHRQHALGAVEQAEPFLRLELERSDPVAGQDPVRRLRVTAPVPEFALPDEGQGQVCERGEIPRRTHGSLRRHHREQVVLEKLDEPFDHDRAHAAVSLGERPRTQQQHGSNDVVAECGPDSGGVAAEE